MVFSVDPVSVRLAPFTEPTRPRLSLTRVADGVERGNASNILEAKGFATVANCVGRLLVILFGERIVKGFPRKIFKS